ncbi:sensor histidine kinase [Silvibacterium dinghuense]|nr:ATP-binding protein [Silvibacterium dinghuense]
MDRQSVRRELVSFLGITAAAVAVALVCRYLAEINQTTAALTFLVLVLLTASRFRIVHSIYLSVLCALLYNFYFLPPIGTFTIHDPQNWIALGAFLSVGILVSHLSDTARQQTRISEARRQEVEQLYGFSQQLMLQDDFRSLARQAPSIAATIFGFRAVALYVRDHDAAHYSDPEAVLLPAAELRKAALALETGARAIDGAQVVPLMFGMRSVGALAVLGSSASHVQLEAIGALVAIALERAATIEQSTHVEAARESERLRSALLDSVTHDLRTPLTSIRAAASTLLSHPNLPNEGRSEMYAVIEEESARLDLLIGRAVEMAQLDAQGIQVKPKPEKIADLVAMALEEARGPLGNRAVTVEIPDNLPRVLLDRELVRRVLRHLIENAARYSPDASSLRIWARVEDYRLMVSLEDRGPGIDEADQPYIFDKFFRGRNQKPGTSGTGMGLAIVKAIMIAHGGGVTMGNRPGGGAIFTLWLPADGQGASTEEPVRD